MLSDLTTGMPYVIYILSIEYDRLIWLFDI